MSESSIFGHQILICQTCCVPPTVLLCSPFADIMVAEAIRSAGKSHQKPHVNLSAPITGWARSQLIDETKQFLWLKVYTRDKALHFYQVLLWFFVNYYTNVGRRGEVFIPHKGKKIKEYTWQRHTVFVWDEKQDISAGRQLSREVFFPCCTVSLGSTMC